MRFLLITILRISDRLLVRHKQNILQNLQKLEGQRRRNYSDEKSGANEENPHTVRNHLEEPTNCCQSGCANCVWIQYAEELIKEFKDGDDKAQKIIEEKVTDPFLRAYLQMELRNMKLNASKNE